MAEADTQAHPGEEGEAQAAIAAAAAQAAGVEAPVEDIPDVSNADESAKLLYELASQVEDELPKETADVPSVDPKESEEEEEPKKEEPEPDTEETTIPGSDPSPEDLEAKPAVEEESSVATAWARAKKAQRESREQQKTIRSMQEQIDQLSLSAKRAQEDLLRDPLAELSKHGVKLEHLNDRVLGDGKQSNAEQASVAQSSALQREQARDREIKEIKDYLVQRDNQQALKDYRNEVSGLLETDDFRVLASLDEAVDEVIEHAGNFAAEHKRVPSAQEAALGVQNEYRKKLKRLGSYEAVRQELGLITKPEKTTGTSKPPETEKQSAQSKSEGASTLSNEEAATSASGSPNGFDDWDETSQLKWLAKQIPDSAWPST